MTCSRGTGGWRLVDGQGGRGTAARVHLRLKTLPKPHPRRPPWPRPHLHSHTFLITSTYRFYLLNTTQPAPALRSLPPTAFPGRTAVRDSCVWPCLLWSCASQCTLHSSLSTCPQYRTRQPPPHLRGHLCSPTSMTAGRAVPRGLSVPSQAVPTPHHRTLCLCSSSPT